MSDLEKQLNVMTDGLFFSLDGIVPNELAHRGLCTYKVKEIQRLLNKFPQIRDVLRQAIAKHVEFWEKYHGLSLEELKEQRDESAGNILGLHRAFPQPFSLAKYVGAKHNGRV